MPGEAPAVVLVGPPAAGKTRIGKRLAVLLGCEYHDTDKMVAADHGPIPEIFAREGEARFREWEREAVQTALGRGGVVSLGGGAVIREDTREDLARHLVAQITISAEAVAPRLNNDKRPLLAGGLEAWVSLVAARQSWYDEVSGATFDASHRSTDDVAADIARWLEGKAR